MKTYIKLTLISFALFTFLGISASADAVGCASTPPTRTESAVFDIYTNMVTVVKTNTLWTTNRVFEEVFTTNNLRVVVTNEVPVPILVYLTNVVPVYDYRQGTNAETIKATAKQIGGIAGGPLGELIAGFASTALLAAWGWWRSTNKSKLAVNSMQAIETIREFIKQLPDGAKYDSALIQWMQQHQAEAGLLNQVVSVLQAKVDNRDAKDAAQSIKDAIAALSK